MTFLSDGTVSLVHDRASRDVGSSQEVVDLRRRWLEPAADRLLTHARNSATLAILRVAGRSNGWDGFGSAGASREAIGRSLAVVETLIREGVQATDNWIDPHVGLNEDGHVAFEWWHGKKKLTLYVGPRDLEYVSSWGPNIESQMDAGVLAEGQFARLWRWLNVPG